jgi:hypothetical protein
MGFETQEAAERWAENAEFAADQAREEKLLSSKSDDVIQPIDQQDARRLALMESNIRRDPSYTKEMLVLAYCLGRCSGRMDMGAMALDIINGAKP